MVVSLVIHPMPGDSQREMAREESVLIGGAGESGAKREKWPHREKHRYFSAPVGLIVDVADTVCIRA